MGGDLITDGWMFNIPAHFTLFNYSFTSSFFNTSTSSSFLHLCSLFYDSLSLATFCNFSIALSTFMLMWTPKLWKHTQLLITNEINIRWLLCLLLSLNFLPSPFIFWLARHLLIHASPLKLWWPIITIFYVPYTATWKHVMSSLQMNTSNFIFLLFCIHSPLKLVILIPCCYPYTPFVDYVNTSVDCVNTYVDCTNIYVDYANKFAN